ncbi:MAG: EthD family reductase [Actinobacteria bacterium]|nr:MAG: EthD family reductase [Actinomycetota bacterium]
MIKLTFAVRRRADVDPGEFHRYWRDEHGPLVRSFQSVLGIRRYVQVHRVDTPFNDVLRQSRGALEPFDGTAEVWWDDLESLAAGTSTPEGVAAAQALLEDEARFIDLARSALWLGEEVEVIV